MRYISGVNGTRQFGPSGDGSKAEVAFGKADGKFLSPPLPYWTDDRRRKCYGKPTDWWYAPEKDESGQDISTPADAAEAERLCNLCRFTLDCREYGLRNEPFGIWGGVKVTSMRVAKRADLLAEIARERRRRIA